MPTWTPPYVFSSLCAVMLSFFHLCLVTQDSAITPAHLLKSFKDENATASSRTNPLRSHRPVVEAWSCVS